MYIPQQCPFYPNYSCHFKTWSNPTPRCYSTPILLLIQSPPPTTSVPENQLAQTTLTTTETTPNFLNLAHRESQVVPHSSIQIDNAPAPEAYHLEEHHSAIPQLKSAPPEIQKPQSIHQVNKLTAPERVSHLEEQHSRRTSPINPEVEDVKSRITNLENQFHSLQQSHIEQLSRQISAVKPEEAIKTIQQNKSRISSRKNQFQTLQQSSRRQSGGRVSPINPEEEAVKTIPKDKTASLYQSQISPPSNKSGMPLQQHKTGVDGVPQESLRIGPKDHIEIDVVPAEPSTSPHHSRSKNQNVVSVEPVTSPHHSTPKNQSVLSVEPLTSPHHSRSKNQNVVSVEPVTSPHDSKTKNQNDNNEPIYVSLNDLKLGDLPNVTDKTCYDPGLSQLGRLFSSPVVEPLTKVHEKSFDSSGLSQLENLFSTPPPQPKNLAYHQTAYESGLSQLERLFSTPEPKPLSFHQTQISQDSTQNHERTINNLYDLADRYKNLLRLCIAEQEELNERMAEEGEISSELLERVDRLARQGLVYLNQYDICTKKAKSLEGTPIATIVDQTIDHPGLSQLDRLFSTTRNSNASELLNLHAIQKFKQPVSFDTTFSHSAALTTEEKELCRLYKMANAYATLARQCNKEVHLISEIIEKGEGSPDLVEQLVEIGRLGIDYVQQCDMRTKQAIILELKMKKESSKNRNEQDDVLSNLSEPKRFSEADAKKIYDYYLMAERHRKYAEACTREANGLNDLIATTEQPSELIEKMIEIGRIGLEYLNLAHMYTHQAKMVEQNANATSHSESHDRLKIEEELYNKSEEYKQQAERCFVEADKKLTEEGEASLEMLDHVHETAKLGVEYLERAQLSTPQASPIKTVPPNNRFAQLSTSILSQTSDEIDERRELFILAEKFKVHAQSCLIEANHFNMIPKEKQSDEVKLHIKRLVLFGFEYIVEALDCLEKGVNWSHYQALAAGSSNSPNSRSGHVTDTSFYGTHDTFSDTLNSASSYMEILKRAHNSK